MQIDINDELQRFCHVIDMERYNAYINEHIEDPHVSDDCWGKFSVFRQKLFDSNDFYENYLPYLSEIARPQLLIVGEYDMTCGEFEREFFTGHARNGTLEIFNGCAHLLWFEKPEKYTEMISRFVLNVFDRSL
jgi:proline iminopeptidase